MKLDAYIKRLDSAVQTDLICRSCGNKVISFSSVQESICNFCESHVQMSDKDFVHGSKEVEDGLALMQKNASIGNWIDGAQQADALGVGKDPYLAFGAANFYRFFSDYTYYSIDYTLGGFMYGNAEKRSDEPKKNKYNAIALISKSRDFFFRSLKLMDMMKYDDDSAMLIKLIANLRLKRRTHAQAVLEIIDKESKNSIIRDYAHLAFDYNERNSGKRLDSLMSLGIVNSFYYMALRESAHGNINDGIRMMDALASKSNMQLALYSGIRLKAVREASEL